MSDTREMTEGEVIERLEWWLSYFNDETTGRHPDFINDRQGFDESAIEEDLRQALARLRALPDAPEMYCPTCGSCGEDGCCNPGGCIAVQCMYGADSVKAYKESLEENDNLSRALPDGERIEGWATKVGKRDFCLLGVKEAPFNGNPEYVSATLILHNPERE